MKVVRYSRLSLGKALSRNIPGHAPVAPATLPGLVAQHHGAEQVVAAIIVKDSKILATQRGYGEYKDGWEFPGGKVQQGETAEEAIVREIEEELRVTIHPDKFVTTVDYDYPTFHLTMHCFLSSITQGEIELVEHEAMKWLTRDELDTVDWLPADIEVVEALKKLL